MKTRFLVSLSIALSALLLSQSSVAQQTAPADTAVQKASAPNVFSGWLKKDSFKMNFTAPDGSFSATYEVNPVQGYTMFYGWEGPTGRWCAQGKIPTTFTLGDDGKLTLSFKFNHSDCPVIKYEFDQAAGPSGKVYFNPGSGWTLRTAKIELVGYDVSEYKEALAKANVSNEKCADGDLACAARVLKPALGTVIKP